MSGNLVEENHRRNFQSISLSHGYSSIALLMANVLPAPSDVGGNQERNSESPHIFLLCQASTVPWTWSETLAEQHHFSDSLFKKPLRDPLKDF